MEAKADILAITLSKELRQIHLEWTCCVTRVQENCPLQPQIEAGKLPWQNYDTARRVNYYLLSAFWDSHSTFYFFRVHNKCSQITLLFYSCHLQVFPFLFDAVKVRSLITTSNYCTLSAKVNIFVRQVVIANPILLFC